MVAQSVEQRTENPRVGGSIPPQGTNIETTFLLSYFDIEKNISFSGLSHYMLVWLNGRAADL